MRRGEIWWANLPEPWGHGPVLLLAREEAYLARTWLAAAPLTSRIRRNRSSVLLEPSEDGVPSDCIVNLDHVQAIRKEWLDAPITFLSSERMEQVERAIHFALDLRSCR